MADETAQVFAPLEGAGQGPRPEWGAQIFNKEMSTFSEFSRDRGRGRDSREGSVLKPQPTSLTGASEEVWMAGESGGRRKRSRIQPPLDRGGQCGVCGPRGQCGVCGPWGQPTARRGTAARLWGSVTVSHGCRLPQVEGEFCNQGTQSASYRRLTSSMSLESKLLSKKVTSDQVKRRAPDHEKVVAMYLTDEE